ncbi:Pimeloyl-ACP methyl ester carboxylesterase [Saccharopolyspora antimicrobica]|uniref:Pimeloyl-ACP methyl ester carboxylesterase n=1 Tax=Saccharopolyspora antimicrobica TaxID=455193 RepID=A0A1I4SF47_9PSEU|nr:pimeloyl-ACP methyl ester carboxylesterase [Saccharopolyspora antimicrobica]SFM63072.1 Pimeloyl-ACP methyl ester carboxylesterase [Saccharopolyspora antimicrobica]
MTAVADYIQIPTPAGKFDALTAGPQDGRPVLLLHGFPEAAVEWSEQLAVLGGAECFAVAPDQRGYSPGVRPQQVSDYRMTELVDDVLAIAEHFGWDRFDLVGHDWGAVVAWTTAAAHPERIRTLTAVSIPHPDPFNAALREDEDQATRSAYIQEFRSSTAEKALLADNAKKLRRIYYPGVPEHHVDDYVQRLTEPGALTAALNWYRAARYNSREIGPVEVPTLYVWSTEDVAVGSTAALATADHVTGPYRFEMLEDVSHWIPEEAPDTFTRLLLQHLLAHQA